MRLISAARAFATFVMAAWLLPAAGVAQHATDVKDRRGEAPERRALRSIALEDIVTLREIAEQRIAPDGKTVAFVVKQARIGSNDYHTALYVVDEAAGGVPRKLVDEESMSNTRWTPDGQAITYLAARGTAQRLLRVPRQGGQPSIPYPELPSLAAYEWSPDGSRIAVSPVDQSDSVAERRVQAEGLVYTSRHQYKHLVDTRWVQYRPSRLLVYSVGSERLESLWTSSSTEARLLEFSWSPDARHIAIVHHATGRPADLNNYDLAIMALDTKVIKPVTTWIGFEWNPQWSPDGRSLAFQSQGDLPERVGTTHDNGVFVASRDGGPAISLGSFAALSDARIIGWSAGGDSVIFERSGRNTGAVYSAPARGGGIRLVSATADHLSDCVKAGHQPILSCIRQNVTMPPEIALLDLESGKVRNLTHLNPEYDDIKLGNANELRWRNRYGNETNGFLVFPTDFMPGARYPFLIVLYGFERKFTTDAQGYTSFPVQAFAREGFVVLMMNSPPMPAFGLEGPGGQGAFAEIDNPLASIEAAADTLIAMGVADPSRGGLLGWSMGSYWTDLTITRTNRFKAVSSGETGLRSAATYWLYGDEWRYYQRGAMGSPVGTGYLDYLRKASPAAMAPPDDVAILKEYESRALHGLEYVLWWEQGAQMELVFYPDEEHVFVQPVHRLASMRRNLAWFNFWLRGIEDVEPSRREEYTRWRFMRDTIATRTHMRLRVQR